MTVHTVEMTDVGRALAVVLAVGAGAVAGCSSSGDDVASDEVVTVASAETTPPVDEDVFTEAGDSGSDDGVSSDDDDLGPVPPPLPTDVVSDVVDSIEPVVDTGVPGIESDDDFCRAWSEFAGSYQALTFSWAVVGGVESARLELVANDALRSAVVTLGETLPDELEAERQALTVDLTTPILRRADRGREILSEQGVSADANAALGGLWLAAVTEAGTESESLAVPIDDGELDASVDAAAGVFVGELPPITEDPSLIVDVAIPSTEQYLFDNCPDRGILAGNDNVDT